MDLHKKSAKELKKMLLSSDISCRDVMLSVLNKIDLSEHLIQAFLLLRDKKELLDEADMVDKRRLKGEQVGQLSGLPVAIKDNISTKGIITTAGSQYLKNYTPVYDATVIEAIKNADGIILGKTNMDEFAMGSSTENSSYQITRNPHDLDFVPGGTSGGSAAALAADETILALGSDTGGSIRQPASYCGVVGLKPTYGRVSRYGLIAYGSSFDQIGPMAKNVYDAAMLLNVIAGHDPKDSTSMKIDTPDYTSFLPLGKKLTIGVPEEYFGSGLDKEVHESIMRSLDLLKKNGHKIISLQLPHAEYAIATYYIIICCEASSNLSRYTGVHYGHRTSHANDLFSIYSKSRSEGLGDEVKRRIMLGTYALSSGYYDQYYSKALKVRTLICNDLSDAFKKCDILAHPVAPGPAFRIGEKIDDPMKLYLVDIYSVVANLTGVPAISIPCGKTTCGLPIGIQFTGSHWSESKLLSIGYDLETILHNQGQ